MRSTPFSPLEHLVATETKIDPPAAYILPGDPAYLLFRPRRRVCLRRKPHTLSARGEGCRKAE